MKYNSATIFMFLFLSYLICFSNLLQMKKQNTFDPYLSTPQLQQVNNIQSPLIPNPNQSLVQPKIEHTNLMFGKADPNRAENYVRAHNYDSNNEEEDQLVKFVPHSVEDFQSFAEKKSNQAIEPESTKATTEKELEKSNEKEESKKTEDIPVKSEESKVLKEVESEDDEEEENDKTEVAQENVEALNESKNIEAKTVELPTKVEERKNLMVEDHSTKIEEIHESKVEEVKEEKLLNNNEKKVDNQGSNNVVNEINTVIKVDNSMEDEDEDDEEEEENVEEVSEVKKSTEVIEVPHRIESETTMHKESSIVVPEISQVNKEETKSIELDSKKEEKLASVEVKEDIKEQVSNDLLPLPLDKAKVENMEVETEKESKLTEKSEEVEELSKVEPESNEKEISINKENEINSKSNEENPSEEINQEKPNENIHLENNNSKNIENGDEKKSTDEEKEEIIADKDETIDERVKESKEVVVEKKDTNSANESIDSKTGESKENENDEEVEENKVSKSELNINENKKEEEGKQIDQVQIESKVESTANISNQVIQPQKSESKQESSSQSFLQKDSEKSGNLRKTIEQVGLETSNMDYDRKMLKQHDYQDVTYVADISPVGRASINESTQPEYEVLINDGYETPRVFRTMYDQHTTSVVLDKKNKVPEVKKIPRDNEMWGNVKAILNPH